MGTMIVTLAPDATEAQVGFMIPIAMLVASGFVIIMTAWVMSWTPSSHPTLNIALGKGMITLGLATLIGASVWMVNLQSLESLRAICDHGGWRGMMIVVMPALVPLAFGFAFFAWRGLTRRAQETKTRRHPARPSRQG